MTDKQLSTLTSNFIDVLVEKMSKDELKEFARETLEEQYKQFNKWDLVEVIESLLGKEELNQLINNQKEA